MPQYLFQELITIVLPDLFASVNFSKVKLVFFSTANKSKEIKIKKLYIVFLTYLLLYNFFRQNTSGSIPHYN